MREIKFRIWNPQGKRMLFDIENVFDCLKQQIAFDGTMPGRGFTAPYNHKEDGMIWMQYTGLKDKNGVEIYEGDILRYWYSRDTTAKDIVNNTIVVEWEINADFLGYYIPFHETIEVIGNVYDNLELIK